MKQESLKNRILKYLQKRDYFVASGDIQRLAQENGYYSPQNSGRRLRELCEENKIEVEYRKNHAWYRIKNETNTKEISRGDEPRPILPEVLHNGIEQERSQDRLAPQLNLWRTAS